MVTGRDFEGNACEDQELVKIWVRNDAIVKKGAPRRRGAQSALAFHRNGQVTNACTCAHFQRPLLELGLYSFSFFFAVPAVFSNVFQFSGEFLSTETLNKG